MPPGTAYLDHQFRSPLHLGPRSTPTIPDGGKWSVYAETTISTPPHYPYEAIVNLHDWPQWNSFTPDALVTKHPNPHARVLRMEQGTNMTFTVQMTPQERTRSKEVCRYLDPLKHRNDGHKSHEDGGNVTRIRWTMDNANLLTPSFVLKTERVNEIQEGEGDECVYRTWIAFGGLAAGTVQKKYGEALQARLEEFCRDLKERSEKLFKEDPELAKSGNRPAEAVN